MICNTCNYENNPNHRFCGMCGASLPTAAARRINAFDPEPHPSVAGPSFLGLAGPARDTGDSYLLEDEPGTKHRLLYLALILLVVTGTIFAWRWRGQGHAWSALMASRQMMETEATPARTDPVSVTPDAQQAAASGQNPAPSISPSPNKTEPQSSPAPVVGETQSGASPRSEARSEEIRDLKSTSSSEPVRAVAVERETPMVAAQPTDKLAEEGQAFLYGTGGKADCGRARADLFMAAERDNPRAQSLLGTMFATGHCVTADLPTAYHWLSRAQRQDPANRRTAGMMRIVWGEMSADQQQATTLDRR
jgi:hypothetical protein